MEKSDNKPAKRRRAKRLAKIVDHLIAVNLRIPADVWEKCAWAAAALGISRAAFARATLFDATKYTKPPADQDSLMIQLPGALRAALQAGADHYEVGIAEFLVTLGVHQVGVKTGSVPTLVDGVWHWSNPSDEEIA